MKEIKLGDGINYTEEFVYSNNANYNAYGSGHYKSTTTKVSDIVMYVKEERMYE